MTEKTKGSSRNRAAGHLWERRCAIIFRELGYEDVKTSRECSRLRDSQKVDLCNADEDKSGRLPYNIQCKTLNSSAPYHRLLKELEEHNGRRQVNVVVHKMTKKTTGGRFDGIGEYAIMNLDDFYRILKLLRVNDLDKLLTEKRDDK